VTVNTSWLLVQVQNSTRSVTWLQNKIAWGFVKGVVVGVLS